MGRKVMQKEFLWPLREKNAPKQSILRLLWGRGNNENTLGSENVSSTSSTLKFE